MSAMGSHDVHAERRPIHWYVCKGCGARYRTPPEQYACEDRHEDQQ